MPRKAKTPKKANAETADALGILQGASPVETLLDPYGRSPEFRDFRNFLYHCWTNLGIRTPTQLQFDMAEWLQNGPDRMCIMGFRGIGKSWETAAFVVWNLYWDPDKKILIVSGAKRYADDLATFILQIIRTVPGLKFLDCAKRERHSKLAFDVGPAAPHKQPSVASMGITGQLTGSRANIIIADDVETQSNALTEGGREKIGELIKEFDAILLPGGRVIYLGTPQTEASIYSSLPGRGYAVREWPVEYPNEATLARKATRISPSIVEAVRENPLLAGMPTEPERFSLEDLEARRMSYGKSGYARQFLLDTTGDDSLRFPLHLRDLVVYPCQGDAFPDGIQWSPLSDRRTAHPNVGLDGDGFYEPIVEPRTTFSPWSGSIMFVDPAGQGADETAYAVGRMSHGRICVPECTGLQGGFSDATMVTLASVAKKYKVNTIYVESNFGDGMFSKLLQPHVQRIHPCLIEEVRAKASKEKRIIETLEPVMNQHRLVVDPSVIERDGARDSQVGTEVAPRYRLFYQMTRITQDRGCLAHDDRVDALAGMVQCWLETMAKDVAKSIMERQDSEWRKGTLAEIGDLYDIGRPARNSRSGLSGNAGCGPGRLRSAPGRRPGSWPGSARLGPG